MPANPYLWPSMLLKPGAYNTPYGYQVGQGNIPGPLPGDGGMEPDAEATPWGWTFMGRRRKRNVPLSSLGFPFPTTPPYVPPGMPPGTVFSPPYVGPTGSYPMPPPTSDEPVMNPTDPLPPGYPSPTPNLLAGLRPPRRRRLGGPIMGGGVLPGE